MIIKKLPNYNSSQGALKCMKHPIFLSQWPLEFRVYKEVFLRVKSSLDTFGSFYFLEAHNPIPRSLFQRQSWWYLWWYEEKGREDFHNKISLFFMYPIKIRHIQLKSLSLICILLPVHLLHLLKLHNICSLKNNKMSLLCIWDENQGKKKNSFHSKLNKHKLEIQ